MIRAGKVYVNLEDKDQVAVVDLNGRKVLAHWPVAPGGSPVGMSIDTAKHRIFVGCRKPQKMLVMSTDDGKVIADLPIAAGVDATRWDGHQAFASTREGKLSVAEEKGGKFEIVQTVTTGVGTKTMDVDNVARKIYLPTRVRRGEARRTAEGEARIIYGRAGGAMLAGCRGGLPCSVNNLDISLLVLDYKVPSPPQFGWAYSLSTPY